MMWRAPGIEPPWIKFPRHQRPTRQDFPQRLERAFRVRTEIHDRKKVGAVSVFQVFFWVTLEERHVEASVDQRLTHRAHILYVFAKKSVFIFDLHHQNG